MNAEVLLAKFDRVRCTGDGRWLARCPGHDDRNPSLSIRALEDGRLLLHCFAGCEVEKIVAAIGIGLEDLFPPRALAADHVLGERRSFPAADVLRALADEARLVAVAAANLGRGVELTAEDRERLLVAAERIQVGRSVALGR